MKKGVLLLTSLFFLAGCALPLPLKVASWALDGISYLATDKSVAENGLSIIAKKDCSLMRPLKGQPVCIGNGYDIAQVLRNAVASASVTDKGVQAQAMAEFETAAGPPPKKLSPASLSYDPSEFTDAWRFMRQRDAQAAQAAQVAQAARTKPERAARKVSSRARVKSAKAATRPTAATDATDTTDTTDTIGAPAGYDAGEDTAAWAFIQARNGRLVAKPQVGPPEETQQAEDGGGGASSPPKTSEADTVESMATMHMARATESKLDIRPGAGLYYVIGSLTKLINLDRLAQRQVDLKSLVVVAQVRDRPFYREVVGPFKRSEKQTIRRMIETAGVTKAWLTFIDPHRWTLASPAEISVLTLGGAQTASLH
jgi:hypothetical protein